MRALLKLVAWLILCVVISAVSFQSLYDKELKSSYGF